MRIILKLAWRNIWRNKRRSYISVASVLFAVLFAIAADSIERGSYELQINNMVKFSIGYLQIQDVMYEDEPSIDNIMVYDTEIKNKLGRFSKEIDYTVPRLQNFALAATEHKTRGVMIMGFDPDSENRFNSLADQIVDGAYLKNSDNSVMISEGLAEILGLSVNDTLVLIGQGFQGVNASGMYPVRGIVKLSLPEMNNNTVYMPLATAQWFYDAGNRVTSLIIMPVSTKNIGQLAEKIRVELDEEWYSVLTWRDILKDFLRMMQIDVAGNKIISMILYIVIGFGIFGTILTMMLERTREFAMMIAIGMNRTRLALMCLFESIMLSFTGVVAGLLISFPVVFYFNRHPIPLKGEMADMMAEYGFDAIMPTSVDPVVFYSQAVAIFIIAFLIGLYPVYKTLRLEVVQNAK